MLTLDNKIEIVVGDGWYNGKINFVVANDVPKALICQLDILYEGMKNDVAKRIAKREKNNKKQEYNGKRGN